MLLPSERARLAACNGDCSCEACSKRVASDVSSGAVLVATEDHTELMTGEPMEKGIVVKVLSVVSGNRAWIVQKYKTGDRFVHEDDSLLVDLRHYRRLVDVQFQGVKGFISISGLNANGKRVSGPMMFDPESNAVRVASNFLQIAKMVEEVAADPAVAHVIVSVS